MLFAEEQPSLSKSGSCITLGPHLDLYQTHSRAAITNLHHQKLNKNAIAMVEQQQRKKEVLKSNLLSSSGLVLITNIRTDTNQIYALHTKFCISRTKASQRFLFSSKLIYHDDSNYAITRYFCGVLVMSSVRLRKIQFVQIATCTPMFHNYCAFHSKLAVSIFQYIF